MSGEEFSVRKAVNPANVLIDGSKAIATPTTAEQLSTSTARIRWVRIQALNGNSGVMYVGASTIAANRGIRLAANEAVKLEVKTLAAIWLDTSSGGDGVSYVAGKA